MSLPSNRRRDPGGMSPDASLIFAIVGVVAVGVAGTNLIVRLGHAISGTTDQADLPSDPFAVTFGLVDGRIDWPASGWWLLGVLLVLLTVIGLGIATLVSRRSRRRARVDPAASYMGRGRDVETITRSAAAATAERLGVDSTTPGVPIGRTVIGDQELYGSWEDMHIDIWGPRTGKTTSRAIPAILAAARRAKAREQARNNRRINEAPKGPVLVTSNKRDVVDATRDVRAEHGPIWVFDPQGIALEEPTWWFNPLDYVTDEVKASKLADHFSAGSRGPNSRTDAFFDPAGEDLLAALLLAAALDRRPITQVYTWLSNPTDETAIEILRAHDFPLLADQVGGVIYAPEKQRGGVFGTAQQMASCLRYRSVARWVTPDGPNDPRPRFDAAEFIASGGTLYSLSKEGKGTAGPLVTALTVTVVETAEEQAARSPGGRLATPLTGVLDEAANVCRWRELPNLYSHYGSRGIVLMTILQSWSQGVEVWGESGMKKLWSAANVKVYGGGVAETAFLKELGELIGPYDRLSSSTSTGRGSGRSVSRQIQQRQILEVADLAAMPKGRAVVLASGARPTMIRTQPWMTGPYAEQVKASIKAHDPQAQLTLDEAAHELDAVEAELAKEAA